MKTKVLVFIGIFLLILGAAYYFNRKYEVIALSPLRDDGVHDFKVLTWNVHCPKGADNNRQREIADLILNEDVDFVQLNEYCLDSCSVIDSILSKHYPYKNDANAKVKAGDCFYSKTHLIESGQYREIFNCLFSKLFIGKDSLLIIGCHLPGNNHEGQIEIDEVDSLQRVKTFLGYYRNAQEKRIECAQFLKNTIHGNSLPMIVMGDMNDFNVSAPMDSLKDAGMKNAWWEGGLGYGATYHEGWLKLRIDHIYYNDKLKLKDVKVVETDLSDHNILIASFVFAN